MIRILVLVADAKNPSSRLMAYLNLQAEGMTDYELDAISFAGPNEGVQRILNNSGVKRVYLVETGEASHINAGSYRETIFQFLCCHDYDYVFAEGSVLTREIFPTLAAMLDSSLVSGVVDFDMLDESIRVTKVLYGGDCLVDVEMIGPGPRFVTVDTAAMNTIDSEQADSEPMEQLSAPLCQEEDELKPVEIKAGSSKYPPLADAEIIVAGGRGLRDQDGGRLLESLARAINGAVGVSRGALDCDIGEKEILVGLSGCSVTPALYIACGISGATHHLLGLRGAKRIMAINSDPDAPIMRMADYAVIGDLFDVLPELTRMFSE